MIEIEQITESSDRALLLAFFQVERRAILMMLRDVDNRIAQINTKTPPLDDNDILSVIIKDSATPPATGPRR